MSWHENRLRNQTSDVTQIHVRIVLEYRIPEGGVVEEGYKEKYNGEDHCCYTLPPLNPPGSRSMPQRK